MANRLNGKTAIITGAAKGIGAAAARLLAAEGASVVIADVDDEPGQALAAEIGKHRAIYTRCDVTDEAQVAAMVDGAVAKFGGLNVLVNNAAVFDSNGTETPDLDFVRWTRCLAVALNGTFLCTRAAIPHMREAKGGSIVNMGSSAGLFGDAGLSAYNAAKGGIVNYTRSLAIDCGRDNIRVNAVCPGPVVTSRPLISKEEVKAVFLPRIPLGRYAQPEDIARAILYLASDDSEYVTGIMLPVDGGMTIQSGAPDLRGFIQKGGYHAN